MAWRFTASSSTTRMRSLGSDGVAAVARASGASPLLDRVTTTSAPPPGRGRSRNVPPDDWARARARANSISPPPALCVRRNGVTRRCSASTESGVPESHKEIVSDGPLTISLWDSGTPLSVEAERSEEHTSELQSLAYLVCRLLLEKKKTRQLDGQERT